MWFTFLEGSDLNPLSTVRDEWGRSFMDGWKNIQMLFYFNNLDKKSRPMTSLTSFETLCVSRDPVTRLLSTSYKLLLNLTSQMVPYIWDWVRELGKTLPESAVEKITKLKHTSCNSSETEKSCYKF